MLVGCESMNDQLTSNAKRLMLIHNSNGVLRIMISTFLSIFLFQKAGYEPLVIFNVILYCVMPLSFYILSKYVNQKRLLDVYRIGIFFCFLFSIFLVVFQKELARHIVFVAILYGISSGLYWYAYDISTYHFNNLDQRIRYLGYSKAIDKVVNIITPITLGSLITMGSYHYVFIIMTILTAFLFLLSLSLHMPTSNIKKVQLKEYEKKVRDSKDLKRLYRIAFVEGFSGKALTDMVFPILIFLAFQSEFSLGSLNSIFAMISAIVSYILGKKILGDKMMKMTAFSLVGLACSSIIYLFTLSPTTVILYNICYYLLNPLREYGYSHYAYNMIDIENLSSYSTEHFVLREFVLDMGRVCSFLIVFFVLVFAQDQAIYYQLLVCILTVPTLAILYDLVKVEAHVQEVLKKGK